MGKEYIPATPPESGAGWPASRKGKQRGREKKDWAFLAECPDSRDTRPFIEALPTIPCSTQTFSSLSSSPLCLLACSLSLSLKKKKSINLFASLSFHNGHDNYRIPTLVCPSLSLSLSSLLRGKDPSVESDQTECNDSSFQLFFLLNNKFDKYNY